ncbi:MAG TPA: histidine kinase dimerization/phospho-acceptor domain-containing protein [Hyphomicrobium zavarzinii]|nr:histidine kinase dimerization/phospho-acceptor domain-containing protein [Hyphomicrobium zavarzinii]
MAQWSIKGRLIKSLIVLVGLFWISGVLIAGLVVHHEIDEVFDSALRETAEQIIPVALEDYRLEQAGSTGKSSAGRPISTRVGKGHVHYRLRAADGTILAESSAPAISPVLPVKKGFRSSGGFRYYTRYIKDRDLWIEVVQDLFERRETAIGIWISLSSPLLALLPFAALAVYRTIGRATAPISLVSSELEARGGDYLEPIQNAGLPSEIAPVVDAINTLMARLKRAIESEREFAANAAHELRNPIASARAQVQVLASRLVGSSEQARAENIASQLGQLGRRIEKLLEMSRAAAGLGHSRERSDLNVIAHLLVDEYKHRPDVDGRIHLHLANDAGCRVAMDQDALAIVLRNALENAVVHGDRDQPIDVHVGTDHAIRIVNACPPVAPETLAELKNRFRRGRAPVNTGSGLGLAIVDTIMRQADGSVTLLSPARGRSDGFEIVLKFPAAL